MSETIDLLEQSRQWEFLKNCIAKGHPVQLESAEFENGRLRITINGYNYEEKNEA